MHLGTRVSRVVDANVNDEHEILCLQMGPCRSADEPSRLNHTYADEGASGTPTSASEPAEQNRHANAPARAGTTLARWCHRLGSARTVYRARRNKPHRGHKRAVIAAAHAMLLTRPASAWRAKRPREEPGADYKPGRVGSADLLLAEAGAFSGSCGTAFPARFIVSLYQHTTA